jgi:hypothetical protein
MAGEGSAAMSPAGPEARAAAWRALAADAARLAAIPTRDLVAAQGRFERLAASAGALQLDYSRQHLDAAVVADLVALADAIGLRHSIEAMYGGLIVNATESRARQSRPRCSTSARGCSRSPNRCGRAGSVATAAPRSARW